LPMKGKKLGSVEIKGRKGLRGKVGTDVAQKDGHVGEDFTMIGGEGGRPRGTLDRTKGNGS